MVKNIYQLSFEHNGHGGLRDQIVKAVEKTQASIVRFQAHVPEKCRSTSVLGSYRQGTGIVINPQGHILTVGYLIMEATEVQMVLADDTVVQAQVAGVDFESGLGLLRPTETLDAVPITIGQSLRVANDQLTLTIGGSTGEQTRIITNGRIFATEQFIGYWEYLLDRAFYVVPQNQAFGGSPLLNLEGELIGIVSLQLNQHQGMNLAIPVDLLPSIEGELIQYGRVISRVPRTWIGIYHAPYAEGVVVVEVVQESPAQKAGLRKGDILTHLNHVHVTSEEHFLRQLWTIPIHTQFHLTYIRQNVPRTITMWGIDRYEFYDLGGSQEYSGH
jgi:S1-C subfamily serine protease